MAQPLAQDLLQTVYDGIRPQIVPLLQGRQFKAALTILLKMQEALPDEPALLDDMASCYWGLGDQTAAIGLIRQVTQTTPANATAWGKLGAMCLSTGDGIGAEHAFGQALKLSPRSVQALAALNRIRIFDRKSHRAKTLRKLAESKGLSATDRATACNALGRIEQAAGNHRIAFRFFGKSKKLAGGSFDADAFERHVAGQERHYSVPTKEEPGAAAGPRFIFVVGMPRSGTTLVESILCRHPDVASVGESPALQSTLTTCRKHVAARHGHHGGWDWVEKLSPDEIAQFREQFIQNSLTALDGSAPVIIDKLPFNCLEMGFARTLMPDARFIFLSRHPLDVGLSNFTTNFHTSHGFSRRLDTIGQMTRIVYASLADYEAKLGPCLRRQSYRALVTAPEPEIRALLDHAGLGWDPACLSPEEGTEIVRTASLTQVRAPINTAALGKWQPYEAELAPLVEALGGWNWIEDWQAEDNRAAANN